MWLVHVLISLLRRRCCEDESPRNHRCTKSPWHLEPPAQEATAPEHIPAQTPRTPAGWLWTQGHPSPSSCEMPSTDLWGILHSCRDLVRSEKRLLGTSIVSMLQRW